MDLLFCCEFYHPSRGGVQEVMRQVAENLVAMGHSVTVLTTRLPERDFAVWNGVRVVGFDIEGNHVRGMRGEIGRYQAYLRSFTGDAVLIKAAQQWTFDAAWDVLDEIAARKVFIPCGFSGLYEPAYSGYFRRLPTILRKFDRLIFYAERYRDIDFARSHGLSALTVLSNGASKAEFAAAPDPTFRARHGIGADELVLLTVGTPVTTKGHAEVAAAFGCLDTTSRPMTLILCGEWPKPPASPPAPAPPAAPAQSPPAPALPVPSLPAGPGLIDRARALWRNKGTAHLMRRALLSLSWRARTLLIRVALQPPLWLARTAVQLTRWGIARGGHHATRLAHKFRVGPEPGLSTPPRRPAPVPLRPPTIDDWIERARQQPRKRVLKVHLSREETVQAFLNADLFVFASNIEYSPLVLFEAAAAGLPFITVPVGNAEEIVRWTGGGVLCPADKDARGYTRVDPRVLARSIQALADSPDLRRQLGEAGREAWRRRFNWPAIAKLYESVLNGEGENEPAVRRPNNAAQLRAAERSAALSDAGAA